MSNSPTPLAENPRVVRAVGIAFVCALLLLGFLLGRQSAPKQSDSAIVAEVHALSQQIDKLQHDCPKP